MGLMRKRVRVRSGMRICKSRRGMRVLGLSRSEVDDKELRIVNDHGWTMEFESLTTQ